MMRYLCHPPDAGMWYRWQHANTKCSVSHCCEPTAQSQVNLRPQRWIYCWVKSRLYKGRRLIYLECFLRVLQHWDKVYPISFLLHFVLRSVGSWKYSHHVQSSHSCVLRQQQSIMQFVLQTLKGATEKRQYWAFSHNASPQHTLTWKYS